MLFQIQFLLLLLISSGAVAAQTVYQSDKVFIQLPVNQRQGQVVKQVLLTDHVVSIVSFEIDSGSGIPNGQATIMATLFTTSSTSSVDPQRASRTSNVTTYVITGQ